MTATPPRSVTASWTYATVASSSRHRRRARSRHPGSERSRQRDERPHMSGFVALHLRPIRHQPLRTLLSISGVAVGIALMIAMLGMFSSMTSAADRLTGLAGGADIEVSAPNDAGLPAGLTEQVAAVDGVKLAAPLMRASVIVKRTPVLMLGLDERLAQVGGGAIDLGACVPSKLRQG